MNKLLIAIGIILLIVSAILFFNYSTLFTDKKECDKLLHKNVQYALCYENDKIVVTTQHVNVYKATKTHKWRYNKIEVFDKPGGEIVKTYEGELYFDLKAKCI